jgi:hypothetical protein
MFTKIIPKEYIVFLKIFVFFKHKNTNAFLSNTSDTAGKKIHNVIFFTVPQSQYWPCTVHWCEQKTKNKNKQKYMYNRTEIRQEATIT